MDMIWHACVMADKASVSDFSSFNGSPILLSSSLVTCEELQKRIESLQHQNKVLKVELETNKLLEVELEHYKLLVKKICKKKIEDCG
jgi:hypothetical protein